MAEASEEIIPQKIHFTVSTPPATRQEILSGIRDGAERKKRISPLEEQLGWRDYTLNIEEKAALSSLLTNANNKLKAIGIENDALLPQSEQIKFIQYDQDNFGGFTGIYGEYIIVYMPRGSTLANLEVQAALYHEIGHFVTAVVIEGKEGSKNYSYIARGFDKNARNLKEYGIDAIRGLFEEPLQELFALYCTDDDALVLPSSYRLRVPFMISLLEEYTRRKNEDPSMMFKKVYRANALRDFSLQRELVKVFGGDFVRRLNTILVVNHAGDMGMSEGIDAEFLKNLAERGKFSLPYAALQQSFDQGGLISYPGLKGRIIKTDYPVE